MGDPATGDGRQPAAAQDGPHAVAPVPSTPPQRAASHRGPGGQAPAAATGSPGGAGRQLDGAAADKPVRPGTVSEPDKGLARTPGVRFRELPRRPAPLADSERPPRAAAPAAILRPGSGPPAPPAPVLTRAVLQAADREAARTRAERTASGAGPALPGADAPGDVRAHALSLAGSYAGTSYAGSVAATSIWCGPPRA